MDLIRWELRKIFGFQTVIPALIITVLLNVILFFLSSPGAVGAASMEEMVEKIDQQRQKAVEYRGVINDEWIERYRKQAEEILQHPQYRVSEEEEALIREDLMKERGLDPSYIDEHLRAFFLTEEGMRKFNELEEIDFASRFYELAALTGEQRAQMYLDQYPGEKGKTLASATMRYYETFESDFAAIYDYSWGYGRFRALQMMTPFTVGILLLLALAPLFSDEYTKRTASLLLTSKRVKSLVRAKIISGLLFATGTWLLLTLMNALLSFGMFSTQGWQAFWQNWTTDSAPFFWNQGEVTMVSVLTSLFGTLFFALVVMMISSLSKTPILSTVLGATTLLFPFYLFAGGIASIIGKLAWFLPTFLLMGVSVWRSFELLMLFGQPILIQYVALAVGLSLCVVCIVAVRHIFLSFQVSK